jgi:hypothetical protein
MKRFENDWRRFDVAVPKRPGHARILPLTAPDNNRPGSARNAIVPGRAVDPAARACCHGADLPQRGI